MNKVLIVDDELLVRNYLRTLIPWEKHGYVICGEAANGIAGAEMVKQHLPHIVILDIHMPGMDGVSLCNHIRMKHPSTKMIVLSSYDKYDYVRETLKGGAVDYLLKHELDQRGLLEVLGKARNEILKEAKSVQEKEQLMKKWEAVSPTVTQNYIKELVLGTEDRFEEIKDYFENSVPIGKENKMVAVMQVINFLISTEKYTDREKNSFIRSIQDITEQSLGVSEKAITTYIDQGKYVFLFTFGNSRSEAHMLQSLNSDLQRIQRSLYKYLNINVVFGCSKICYRLTDIQSAYQQSNYDLEQHLLMQYKGHQWKVESNTAKTATLSIQKEKALLSSLEMLDCPKMLSVLKDIFVSLHEQPANTYSIQAIVSEIINLSNKVWRKSGMEDASYLEVESLSRDQLSQYKHLDQIENGLRNLYLHLLDRMTMHQNQGYSPYVKQVMKYVKEHYQENISLDQTAEQVGITPSYLGRKFKEETGSSFTEYLNRLRVEISKRRMEEGQKLKDIYADVGFSSYNYFFKVFKDVAGVTPHTFVKTKTNGN